MHPEIHFDYLEPNRWAGKSFLALYAEMETLRKAVKKASGYGWDNTHFYIDDLFGKPAIQIQFWPTNLSIWSAQTGTNFGSIESLDNTVSPFVLERLDKVRRGVEKGLTECNVCREWVKHFVRYSFAGAVCSKCFDPEKHKGPDTRGD